MFFLLPFGESIQHDFKQLKDNKWKGSQIIHVLGGSFALKSSIELRAMLDLHELHWFYIYVKAIQRDQKWRIVTYRALFKLYVPQPRSKAVI